MFLASNMLLRQLRDGEGAVLLRAAGGERRETDHEKVQTRERDEVHRELAQDQRSADPGSAGTRDAGHDRGDEVVQVAERRRRQLQGAEADVVQGLVVKDHALVGVLDELVHGERRVVRLDDGVGHLRGREDGERHHHAVGVLLADLGDQESAHAGAGAAAQRVGHWKPWRQSQRLGLLAHDVKDGVDELGALGVVALGPVVAGASLAEDEVVRAEDLAERAEPDGVHGARARGP